MTYPDQSQYLQSILSAEDNFDRLSDLRPVPGLRGEPYMDSGNFSVVFKMTDGMKEYAVKCFTRELPGRTEAYTKITRSLAAIESQYMVDMEYLDDELYVDVNGGAEFPVLKMEWIDGVPLDRYVRQARGDSQRLRQLGDRFCDMARWLLSQPIAHGDLKPDNILVRRDGTLALVDYDGMFVPSMAGEKWRESGTPPYSHRLHREMPFDAHADDYAVILIALMLRVVEACGVDYDALASAAGKGIEAFMECLGSSGVIGDARVCALLAAYHKVYTYGTIDGSLAGMLLSLGDDVERCRLLDAGAETNLATTPKSLNEAAKAAKEFVKVFSEKFNIIDGHAYVDLGLSVKWATCNVGADSPEDYGDYYAWGETSVKSSYEEPNCLTYNKPIGEIGGTSRDAAHVKWGGSWRMPTDDEMEELCTKCAWTPTTLGGKSGYKVTGPSGKSIFLPAAGYRYGTSLYNAGYYGYYWISTPSELPFFPVYHLAFGGSNHSVSSDYDLCNGLPVRPVLCDSSLDLPF